MQLSFQSSFTLYFLNFEIYLPEIVIKVISFDTNLNYSLRLYFRHHLENGDHIEKLRNGSIANFNQWVEPNIF